MIRPRLDTRTLLASLLATMILIGIGVRVQHLEPRSRTADEIFYASYALMIVENGVGFVPEIIRRYEARPHLWQYPSPTRVGSLLLAAGAVKLTGNGDARSIALLSTVFSALGLITVAVFTVRYLGIPAAVLAVAFLALSPLDLAIARRGWLDGVFAVLAFLTLWCALEAMRRPHRFLWLVLAGLFGGAASLVKESGLLATGAALVATTIVGWGRHGLRGLWTNLGTLVAVAIATAALLMAAAGGIDGVGHIATRILQSTAENDYMREYQTGSPLYYVRGFGILHPVPFTLGAVACVLGLGRLSRLSRGPHANAATDARAVLVLYVVALVLVAAIFPQKNLRFLSMIYAPTYILAADLLIRVMAVVRRRLQGRWGALAVGGVCGLLLVSLMLDVGRFTYWFVELNIPDLATPWFQRPDR